MSQKPKISVVIPTFNRPQLLCRAVKSVFEQTNLPNELILVDDGSQDLENQDVQSLVKSSPIKIKSIKQPHLGVSASRNHGVSRSEGEWIAFLDSDDEWLPQKNQRQYEVIRDKPDTALIHCNELWVKDGKHLNQKKYHKKSGGDIFNISLQRCMVSPSATIIRKSEFWKQGGFRVDFPVCEDYDLWLKVCSQNTVEYLQEPLLIKYGGHADQLSEKFIGMDYYRLLSISHIIKKLEYQNHYDAAKKLALKKLRVLLRGSLKHHNSSLLLAVQDIGYNLLEDIRFMEKYFGRQQSKE